MTNCNSKNGISGKLEKDNQIQERMKADAKICAMAPAGKSSYTGSIFILTSDKTLQSRPQKTPQFHRRIPYPAWTAWALGGKIARGRA